MPHDHTATDRALLVSVLAGFLIVGAGCGTQSTSPQPTSGNTTPPTTPGDTTPPTTPGGTTPPATVPEPPVPPKVTFFCSFASAASECGFGEQAKVPGRAGIVSSALVNSVAGLARLASVLGRDGPSAVRLHTEPGDSNVDGSLENERNDLALSQAATDCFEGREQWWAHSMLFPDDYVDPPESTASTWNWATLFDFHNTSPGPGQVSFQVNAWPVTAISQDRPTGLAFQIAYGDPASPTVKRFPIGPVVRNVWYDFVYHVKWSSGSDGFFTAWVNGAKKMNYSGPTLYAGQGCYLKLANYHTPFGKPSSVIHDRVIRGTTPTAVSLTPLD